MGYETRAYCDVTDWTAGKSREELIELLQASRVRELERGEELQDSVSKRDHENLQAEYDDLERERDREVERRRDIETFIDGLETDAAAGDIAAVFGALADRCEYPNVKGSIRASVANLPDAPILPEDALIRALANVASLTENLARVTRERDAALYSASQAKPKRTRKAKGQEGSR